MREHIEAINRWTDELKKQREQQEREALAREPFSNDVFEWDEAMTQSPGSYVAQMEWLQRVRDWGKDQDYTWDKERSCFVREYTQQDVTDAAAEGHSLTYTVDREGKHVIDISVDVAKAYVEAHPGDPQPEPGKWSTI
jgi:hypothetical protein